MTDKTSDTDMLVVGAGPTGLLLAAELAQGGVTIDRIRLFGQADLDLTRLPTRYPYVLVTPQYEARDTTPMTADSVPRGRPPAPSPP